MTWKKKFWERYKMENKHYDKFPKRIADPMLLDDIQDFIQSLLQEVGEKVVGEGQVFEEHKEVSFGKINRIRGYNFKRDSDIKILQDYGVKVK